MNYSPLPDYIPASWHGMTPVDQDSGQIGVSLEDEAGNIHRFVLSLESLSALIETGREHLEEAGIQSLNARLSQVEVTVRRFDAYLESVREHAELMRKIDAALSGKREG